MNADGTGLMPLTAGATASWSPDGNRIAVGCYLGAFIGQLEFTDCGERGVFQIDVNGSNRSRLADGFDPAYAPDGQRLAYASGQQEGRSVQIRVLDLTTLASSLLTTVTDAVLDREPCWLDEHRIVFASKDVPTTYRQVHAISTDGTHRDTLGTGSGPSCSSGGGS